MARRIGMRRRGKGKVAEKNGGREEERRKRKGEEEEGGKLYRRERMRDGIRSDEWRPGEHLYGCVTVL